MSKMPLLIKRFILPVMLVLVTLAGYQVILATAPKAKTFSSANHSNPKGEEKKQAGGEAKAKKTSDSQKAQQSNQYAASKSNSQRSGFGKTSAASVAVLTLQQGSYQPQITLYGKVKSYQQQWLTAPVSTQVLSIDAVPGDRVEQGQLLMQLDADDLQAQVDQLQARLNNSEAAIRLAKLQQNGDLDALEIDQELLRIAKLSLKRYENLSNQQLTSSNEYEDALKSYQAQLNTLQSRELTIAMHQDSLDQLQAQYDEVQAQLNNAKHQLQETQIVAPFDGVVAQVPVDVGDDVSVREQLILVFDDQQMGLETKVPLKWANSLSQGGTILARANGYHLAMTDIDAVTDNGVVAARFKFNDSIKEALGRHLQITVNLPEISNVYAVPASSLYENRLLYLVAEGLLKAQPVSLQGHINRNGKTWALVSTTEPLNEHQVLVTRLPNAATGLQVRALESAS